MRWFNVCVLATVPLFAQDWEPVRIVAITDYPPLARAARIEGGVQVRCSLDRDGNVTDAEALSGNLILKEQAHQNALLWKFRRTSAKEGGDNTIVLNYNYSLEGAPRERSIVTFVVDLPGRIHVAAAPLPIVFGAP